MSQAITYTSDLGPHLIEIPAFARKDDLDRHVRTIDSTWNVRRGNVQRDAECSGRLLAGIVPHERLGAILLKALPGVRVLLCREEDTDCGEKVINLTSTATDTRTYG